MAIFQANDLLNGWLWSPISEDAEPPDGHQYRLEHDESELEAGHTSWIDTVARAIGGLPDAVFSLPSVSLRFQEPGLTVEDGFNNLKYLANA